MSKLALEERMDALEKNIAGPLDDLDRRFRRLEAIHRDVDFANRYRLEFIKHCMSLAAAVFIFTVAFIKDIVPTGATPQHPWLIAVSWGAMILSLFGGLGHFAGWDRYYISYRDHANDRAAGDVARSRINLLRRIAMAGQLVGFVVGLAALAIFCLLNL